MNTYLHSRFIRTTGLPQRVRLAFAVRGFTCLPVGRLLSLTAQTVPVQPLKRPYKTAV